MSKVYFNAKDGTRLCGIWDLPSNKIHKVIILAHGITVDKDEDGVFTSLSNLLRENSYAVFRFDFRGHGESQGNSIDMTITGEISDLESAYDYVKSQGYKEVGLVGASFGGGVSTLFALKHQDKLKCICLWNPCLNYNHCFLNPTLPWIRNRKEHMRKDLQEKGWTTLGSNKFVIGKPLFDEMATLFPYKELKNIKIPLVILHGNKDTYVPYEDSKEAVVGMKNGSLVTIKNGEHGFHEPEEKMQEADNETLKFFKKYL